MEIDFDLPPIFDECDGGYDDLSAESSFHDMGSLETPVDFDLPSTFDVYEDLVVDVDLPPVFDVYPDEADSTTCLTFFHRVASASKVFDKSPCSDKTFNECDFSLYEELGEATENTIKVFDKSPHRGLSFLKAQEALGPKDHNYGNSASLPFIDVVEQVPKLYPPQVSFSLHQFTVHLQTRMLAVVKNHENLWFPDDSVDAMEILFPYESGGVHTARDQLRLSLPPMLACDVAEVCDKMPQHGNKYYSHGIGKFPYMASIVEVTLGHASIKVSLVVVIQVTKLLNIVGVLTMLLFTRAKRQKWVIYTSESYKVLVEFFKKIQELEMIHDLVHHIQIKGLLTRETCALICYGYARARTVKVPTETYKRMKKFGLSFIFLKHDAETDNKVFESCLRSSFFFLTSGYKKKGAFNLFEYEYLLRDVVDTGSNAPGSVGYRNGMVYGSLQCACFSATFTVLVAALVEYPMTFDEVVFFTALAAATLVLFVLGRLIYGLRRGKFKQLKSPILCDKLCYTTNNILLVVVLMLSTSLCILLLVVNLIRCYHGDNFEVLWDWKRHMSSKKNLYVVLYRSPAASAHVSTFGVVLYPAYLTAVDNTHLGEENHNSIKDKKKVHEIYGTRECIKNGIYAFVVLVGNESLPGNIDFFACSGTSRGYPTQKRVNNVSEVHESTWTKTWYLKDELDKMFMKSDFVIGSGACLDHLMEEIQQGSLPTDYHSCCVDHLFVHTNPNFKAFWLIVWIRHMVILDVYYEIHFDVYYDSLCTNYISEDEAGLKFEDEFL